VSEKPVRVRYALTDRGRELESVLDPMLRWGREHLGPDGVDRPDGPASPSLPSRPDEEGAADE